QPPPRLERARVRPAQRQDRKVRDDRLGTSGDDSAAISTRRSPRIREARNGRDVSCAQLRTSWNWLAREARRTTPHDEQSNREKLEPPRPPRILCDLCVEINAWSIGRSPAFRLEESHQFREGFARA